MRRKTLSRLEEVPLLSLLRALLFSECCSPWGSTWFPGDGGVDASTQYVRVFRRMIGKMDIQQVVQWSVWVCVCVCVRAEPAQDWETLIFFVDSRGLPPTYQQASMLSTGSAPIYDI